ncbi:hypothetical protein Plav_1469 [Parvibaculum lavamentivorans DS-1]|uniref:Uncharacterized protein n=2 Tax=Parvibaculum lavamentivorans TaxID=256618 RepID=A7HT56_PARL1|nr:hypothetical protein Plav_1469 [Parvibaculum lavamentivorans DS-1]
MPFSATRDAEAYWRTRYGLPPGAQRQPSGARRRNHPFRLPAFRFLSPRRPRMRLWIAGLFLVVTGIAVLLLSFGSVDEPASANAVTASNAVADGAASDAPAAAEADFSVLLSEFSSAREASLIALEGYLLTDGEGFRQEWLDATVRLQSATDAIERRSTTWKDGRRLVQLVEMKRVVGQMIGEQSAVAAIIGTPNRYPGLQLFNEDVRPALGEAQAISAEVLNAMLADSSPEDAVAIDPVARLRGDLEDLRTALLQHIPLSGEEPPFAFDTGSFDMLRETIRNVRDTAPAAAQPKIDRLVFLVASAEEKLQRIFALRESRRWDYAEYAFKTRAMPLVEKLREIIAEWERAA